MKLFFILCVWLFFCSCNKRSDGGDVSAKNNSAGSSLFRAAVSDNFSLDKKIQGRLHKQKDTVLGRLYLESLVNKRVSVSVDEVSNYYNKTKNQHKRTSREFLLMRFTTTNKDTAVYIRRELLKNSGEQQNENRLGLLIDDFFPNRELIKEEDLFDFIKKQFLTRKGKPAIIGPVSSGEVFSVFYLLKTYEKGTTKELVHIQDEIRSKIYSTKAHSIRSALIDSLAVLYGRDSK